MNHFKKFNYIPESKNTQSQQDRIDNSQDSILYSQNIQDRSYGVELSVEESQAGDLLEEDVLLEEVVEEIQWSCVEPRFARSC